MEMDAIISEYLAMGKNSLIHKDDPFLPSSRVGA